MDYNSDPADGTEDIPLARSQERTIEMTGIALWLARQQWLDMAADARPPAVRRAFDALGPARRSVKNVLHATWLGHPLHPVLTDIPLGWWTATIVLDALGDHSDRSGVAYAADATLALGLAGAILLVKRDGRVCALVEKCAHLGGPLAEGRLEGDTVVCPWHSSRFALESGAVVNGPSAFGQTCLEARIPDGQIEMRAQRR